jgi:hypothetical protein
MFAGLNSEPQAAHFLMYLDLVRTTRSQVYSKRSQDRHQSKSPSGADITYSPFGRITGHLKSYLRFALLSGTIREPPG